MNILINGTAFTKNDINLLQSEGLNVESIESKPKKADLIKALKKADIFILAGNVFLDKDVIDLCNNLKLISFYGSGYTSFMDAEYIEAKGIMISNTPTANSTSVAEHNIALMLDAVKNITYLNNEIRDREWRSKETWNLSGKTLGILGMGNIGSRVATTMHHGFNMNIIYLSRNRKFTIEKNLKAKKVDLATLLKESDVLSITASVNQKTKGMISQKELKMMKKHAVLVNTSNPGWIVNPKSLTEALKNNHIACAAYDSYYIEPVDKENDKYGLLELPEDKFILTPHNAYNSRDAKKAMKQMTIENILTFCKDGRPKFLAI